MIVNTVSSSEVTTVDLASTNALVDNMTVTTAFACTGDFEASGTFQFESMENPFPQKGTMNQLLASDGDGNIIYVTTGGVGSIDGITTNANTLVVSNEVEGIVNIDIKEIETVTPGSYTNTNLTVNEYGQITACSSGEDTGITQITNTDGNLIISVNDDDATINLEPDITLDSGDNNKITIN